MIQQAGRYTPLTGVPCGVPCGRFRGVCGGAGRGCALTIIKVSTHERATQCRNNNQIFSRGGGHSIGQLMLRAARELGNTGPTRSTSEPVDTVSAVRFYAFVCAVCLLYECCWVDSDAAGVLLFDMLEVERRVCGVFGLCCCRRTVFRLVLRVLLCFIVV